VFRAEGLAAAIDERATMPQAALGRGGVSIARSIAILEPRRLPRHAGAAVAAE
jgi:hypothetical protein